MAKSGRPKKYNNLVQFNLYVERSDLEIFRRSVAVLNEKHKTSDHTLASLTRDVFSKKARALEKHLSALEQEFDFNADDQFGWIPPKS